MEQRSARPVTSAGVILIPARPKKGERALIMRLVARIEFIVTDMVGVCEELVRNSKKVFWALRCKAPLLLMTECREARNRGYSNEFPSPAIYHCVIARSDAEIPAEYRKYLQILLHMRRESQRASDLTDSRAP